jgi:hypothetical protein
LNAFTGGLLDEHEQVDIRRGPWFDERTVGPAPSERIVEATSIELSDKSGEHPD